MKNKFMWLAATLLAASATALAGDEMPWTFNGTRVAGYSIDLLSVDPAPGTPLVRGSSVEIKVTAKFAMTIAPAGKVLLVLQDDKNKHVEATRTPESAPVSGPAGTVTLSATIPVVPKSKEIRIFVPLVPNGLQSTDGEIVIRYPIVKKR
jgi:hypothetical protein